MVGGIKCMSISVFRIRRILKFLGLPDPDTLVRGTDPDPDHSTSSKNSKKTFISTVLCLIYDFLSLKNDLIVPSKSNMQTNRKWVFSCWRFEGH